MGFGPRIWHSLAGVLLFHTVSVEGTLGDIQLLAGLEGPRWLNSHAQHLGMGIWKAAGLSWALPHVLLELLNKAS